MDSKWLYAIGGLLIGSILSWLILSSTKNTQQALSTNEEHESHNMQTMMDDMTRALKDKHGEEFDKVFLSEMIVHHQGAIDMANLAKIRPTHKELKELAEDIISAQTKEIEMMKQWQKDWGY